MANPLCLHCYRTYETIRSSTFLLSQHEAMSSFRTTSHQQPNKGQPLSKMAFAQESTAFADIYAPGQQIISEQPTPVSTSRKATPTFVPVYPPPTTKFPPPINTLPPELLDEVLDSFSTPALLPFASVNRRFHNLVARLLYRRLRRAVALANHQLILACYHPSAKISSPYLNCTYLGTEGLDLPCFDSDKDDGAPEGTLLRMPTMYSRFRPVPPNESDVHVRNYRAIRRTMNFFLLSDTTSGGTAATALQTSRANDGSGGDNNVPLVSYDVHLDEGELFSQLCTVTNLVKTSAQPGMFLNCVNINDGVIRVWRDWLDQRASGEAETASTKPAQPSNSSTKTAQPSNSSTKTTKTTKTTPSSTIPSIADTDSHVLWAYSGKHVGMRFRVAERSLPQSRLDAMAAAAALHDNERFRRSTMPPEEPPVSFVLEYEELLVRTYELLLAMEAAEAQDETRETRGVIMSAL